MVEAAAEVLVVEAVASEVLAAVAAAAVAQGVVGSRKELKNNITYFFFRSLIIFLIPISVRADQKLYSSFKATSAEQIQ